MTLLDLYCWINDLAAIPLLYALNVHLRTIGFLLAVTAK